MKHITHDDPQLSELISKQFVAMLLHFGSSVGFNLPLTPSATANNEAQAGRMTVVEYREGAC